MLKVVGVKVFVRFEVFFACWGFLLLKLDIKSGECLDVKKM
jgi:hypothetical protein